MQAAGTCRRKPPRKRRRHLHAPRYAVQHHPSAGVPSADGVHHLDFGHCHLPVRGLGVELCWMGAVCDGDPRRLRQMRIKADLHSLLGGTLARELQQLCPVDLEDVDLPRCQDLLHSLVPVQQQNSLRSLGHGDIGVKLARNTWREGSAQADGLHTRRSRHDLGLESLHLLGGDWRRRVNDLGGSTACSTQQSGAGAGLAAHKLGDLRDAGLLKAQGDIFAAATA
mmetsp:Transcript_529/g.1595  ORF Transcript_529/g.1595 Transcript_529/m.1595 type:complete len:225 (-) Transcript_529:2470-3144(-)